jgi:transcriptional/translational regulatory protein YebC/TACO1
MKFHFHVYLMPTRSGRKLKERLTVSCDPINIDRINQSLENKEFSSVSSLVNNALSFYFENRGKEQKELFRKFLESPEGEESIMKIFDKICKKRNIKPP